MHILYCPLYIDLRLKFGFRLNGGGQIDYSMQSLMNMHEFDEFKSSVTFINSSTHLGSELRMKECHHTRSLLLQREQLLILCFFVTIHTLAIIVCMRWKEIKPCLLADFR